MKNEFADHMAKCTDAELEKILEQQNDYQPDAVEAAKQQINIRNNKRDQVSKLSNEQLVDLIKLKQKNINHYDIEIEAAEAEAKKRNIIIQSEESTITNQSYNSTSIEKKYHALRLTSGLYKVLAWIILLGSLAICILTISQGEKGIPLAIGSILGGSALFLTCLALAEGIKVFIDIEHNTRVTALNSKK